MEKSEEEYFPRPDQEGGGEEADGEIVVRGYPYLPEEEKHQDLQRNSRGQVCEIHNSGPVSVPLYSTVSSCRCDSFAVCHK